MVFPRLFIRLVLPILVVVLSLIGLLWGATTLEGQPFGIGAIGSVQFTVNTVAAALAATLGILMALVLLTVQLSAQRFSFNIVDMFIQKPVNLGLILLFVSSITYSLWISIVIRDDFIPGPGTYLALGLATVCFSLLVPYTFHLFEIIRPSNLLDSLRKDTIGAARGVVKGRSIEHGHTFAAERVQHIGDIGRSAVSQGDGDTARRSIRTLQDTLLDYLAVKSSLPPDWFMAEARIVRGRHEAALREIRETGLWMERRIVEELQDVFTAALLAQMDDITHTVSESLRLVGEAAINYRDQPLMRLVAKFFNTFLRATINRGEVRGGYDTLYEYELLAEAALADQPELAMDIAQRLAYYGEAAGGRLLWMAAASAHDLRSLSELNHQRGGLTVVTNRFVELLTDLVERVRPRDAILARQLHKSVVALGSYFITANEIGLANRLRAALDPLAPEELERIYSELLAVTDPEFWEVTERWINFDYIDEPARSAIPSFLRLRTATPVGTSAVNSV